MQGQLQALVPGHQCTNCDNDQLSLLEAHAHAACPYHPASFPIQFQFPVKIIGVVWLSMGPIGSYI